MDSLSERSNQASKLALWSRSSSQVKEATMAESEGTPPSARILITSFKRCCLLRFLACSSDFWPAWPPA